MVALNAAYQLVPGSQPPENFFLRFWQSRRLSANDYLCSLVRFTHLGRALHFGGVFGCFWAFARQRTFWLFVGGCSIMVLIVENGFVACLVPLALFFNFLF